MARFNFTSDGYSLDQAEAWARSSIEYWKKVVAIGNRSYYHDMLFGPTERGHWSDRVGALEANLDMIREAKRVLHLYGVFDKGFDFGSIARATRYRLYSSYHFLNEQFDTPRFMSRSTPQSLYHPDAGYGFAVSLRAWRPVCPAWLDEYQLNGQEPLPRDGYPIQLLACDYVTSQKPIRFRVDLPMDEYQFSYLFADQSDRPIRHGPLNIREVERYVHSMKARDVDVPIGVAVHRVVKHNLGSSWYPCYEFIIEPAAEGARAR